MAIGASPTNPSTGNGLGPCKSVGSEKPKASIGGITCPNEREFKKHGREETEQKAPRILHQRAWFLVLKTGTINHFFPLISWFLDYFVVLLSDFSVKWIFVFLLFPRFLLRNWDLWFWLYVFVYFIIANPCVSIG